MTIEIAVLLSMLSFAFIVWQGTSNSKRNEKAETKNDVSQLTAVIVKLEMIGTGINEIKTEVSSVKTDIQDIRERLVKVEESSKSAHKRLDTFEKEV